MAATAADSTESEAVECVAGRRSGLFQAAKAQCTRGLPLSHFCIVIRLGTRQLHDPPPRFRFRIKKPAGPAGLTGPHPAVGRIAPKDAIERGRRKLGRVAGISGNGNFIRDDMMATKLTILTRRGRRDLLTMASAGLVPPAPARFTAEVATEVPIQAPAGSI